MLTTEPQPGEVYQYNASGAISRTSDPMWRRVKVLWNDGVDIHYRKESFLRRGYCVAKVEQTSIERFMEIACVPPANPQPPSTSDGFLAYLQAALRR